MAIIEHAMADSQPATVLARSRDLVDPALRQAVDTLPPVIDRIAAYHFGWCDENGNPHDASPGKAIRPALVLLSAEAVGGTPTSGVPAAVAVELVHNFSLLHDDIMDGDTTRRHRPTAWRMFGASQAILAGDALLSLALDVLAASGHEATTDGVRMLGAAVLDLIDGQRADLDLEARRDVDLAEGLHMAQNKTGALLGCACALGATFGGDSGRAESLGGFGRSFGMAFQHVDDLLGIWGSPTVTGKPIYSDLRNRKKTLPVLAALWSDTSEGRELATLYSRDDELSDTELAHAANLVDAAGGRRWSQEQADDLLARGLDELRRADLAPRPAAELAALAQFATHRNH